MGEYEIVGAGGPISINKDYRIVFPYNGKFCKVIRFCVAKDGSINFSPYVKDANQIALQKVNPDKNGNIHVEYGIGDITYKEDLKSNNILKVNYHASGIINHGNDRSKSKPIREITSEHELCMIVLMHPLKMSLVDKIDIKKTDMLTWFEIKEEYPIFASITLTKHGVPPTFIPKGRLRWVQLLQFSTGPDKVGDMDLRFYFFEGNAGPWPTECGCLMQLA